MIYSTIKYVGYNNELSITKKILLLPITSSTAYSPASAVKPTPKK
jgi:hypothetical protein